MLIDKPILLNSKIQFQAITNLNEKISEKLGGSTDDYIISLQNSRVHSKRISKESKDFLDQFTNPNLFLDVIYKHAGTLNINSEKLLSSTYPLIKSFVSNGFLEYHKEEQKVVTSKKKLFSINDTINEYSIVSCIQFLDDTEAYKAKNKDGDFVLLKCVRMNTKMLKENFETELEILTILNKKKNPFVPKLLNSFTIDTHSMLVIEWLEGMSLWDYINTNKSIKSETKTKIIAQIIDGYNYIQQCGILHADIHPNNIKVTRTNDIKIFDFGSSMNLDNGEKSSRTRAGVLKYYEPELAVSLLKNNQKIIATKHGEQFQIAALLYQVITGKPYLSLSYETDIALEQITTELPIPFSDFNIEAKSLEKTIRKSLEKKPENRFKNWNDFYKNVHSDILTPIINTSKKNIVIDYSNEINLQQYIDSFRNEYGYDTEKLNNFSINMPNCSFFHGATGIAYTFYRLSHITKNPELLALADVWISKAKLNHKKKGAFSNDKIGMPAKNVGCISLFHNFTGLLIVEALIKKALGLDIAFINSTEQFITEIETNLTLEKDSFFIDPTQGAVSLLFGIAQLTSVGNENNNFPSQKLHLLSKQIINTIIPVIKKSLQVSPNTNNNYLGFAHGYAGLLFAILQINSTVTQPHNRHIKEFLNTLEMYAISSKNKICWSVNMSNQNNAIWSGWCHGTAGHIQLWLAAYKKYKIEKYLDLAIKAGEYLWVTYGQSNASICCGYAGQSFSFFKLGQITSDIKWYKRGVKLTKLALSSKKEFALKDSLFQGKVGLALLAGESIKPEQAIWPICDQVY